MIFGGDGRKKLPAPIPDPDRICKLPLVICISTHNRARTITDELDLLKGRIKNFWPPPFLAVGDNGSTDETPGRVKRWLEKCGLPYFFYPFKHDTDETRVRQRLACTAASFTDSESTFITFLEFENKTELKVLSSFSMVATREVATEAAITIKSLRTFHDEPIFVLCDRETRTEIKRHKFKGIEFKEGASGAALKRLMKEYKDRVAIKNDFHRVDCIAAKMDALEWGLGEAGDTLFLDADIVATSNLNDGFSHELVMSPHFHGTKPTDRCQQFGIFNAGYLWTSHSEVPELWREIYLNRSTFFEQEGMALFGETIPFGTFSAPHNVGFWREPTFPQSVRSWHVHMTDCLDDKANPGLRAKYIEHRGRVTDELIRGGRAELVHFIEGLNGK